ncbi:phospho-N-acetylmuramoyl-pentapeptide-transferase [Treponema pedis]|uniref:phospho-N-acetylmuramoyl-pentapeptide- transferase n=1 Tax=Treponema pedis TaxID=409322 RepID=UPI00042A15C9|nr:phospho-N-acetylmuramoyl-pentapeptide-transferase [Treponema pedis]
MLYQISELLAQYFGPMRLLQSYTVLISIGLFLGFLLTVFLLPKFYSKLPKDRGREFTVNPEAAVGKPTGAGIVFIPIFIVCVFILIKPTLTQGLAALLTFAVMMTGYLDDRSIKSWGEYLKGSLDLILSIIMSLIIFYVYFQGTVTFWLPFTSNFVTVPPAVFFITSTLILWISINTTNCTDGVDGLSGTLILIALVSLGIVFYFILGHVKVASYLLVPNIASGAKWAVMIFTLCGVLTGYLWHNAYPSRVLMGDAGSRSLGFFIGILVIISGNPFILLMTSGVILINGGTGILKIVLLRFFKIKIFKNIRFPLHDHMKKNLQWSPTQVLLRFMILQILITIVVLGILFKVR